MKGELPKGRLIVKAKGAMICSASTFPELLNRTFKTFQPFNPPDRVRGPFKSFSGSRITNKVARLLNCANPQLSDLGERR